MMPKKKIKFRRVRLLSMSTPVGKGKLLRFPSVKGRKAKRKKLKKFSITGAFKPVGEKVKLVRLRYFQRKKGYQPR